MTSIEIVEVAPRDGLQSEDVVWPTEQKVELIERAIRAGIGRLEVCSFVHPGRVPAMADAEAVLAALPVRDDITYIGLVLNQRGFDRAAAAGMREINVVAAASDTFGQRNQGMTVEQTVENFESIAAHADAAGIRASLTISTAFGCPYEGEVDAAVVTELARRASAAGAFEVAIADTIGVAVPTMVAERLGAVRAAMDPATQLRAHFHNTRNTGLANAWAAVETGATVLDSSLAGIGGCPFAPKATGNIPTEDLCFLLERSGVTTGIDLAALVEVVPWIEERLGKPTPGLLARAGLFPPTH